MLASGCCFRSSSQLVLVISLYLCQAISYYNQLLSATCWCIEETLQTALIMLGDHSGGVLGGVVELGCCLGYGLSWVVQLGNSGFSVSGLMWSLCQTSIIAELACSPYQKELKYKKPKKSKRRSKKLKDKYKFTLCMYYHALLAPSVGA